MWTHSLFNPSGSSSPALLRAFGRTGLVLWGAACAHAGDAWPVIPVPPHVYTFSVGEQLTSNGMPMRVKGFVSGDRSSADIAEWFRKNLGGPLVEDRRAEKLILGRAQDGYYLTVQIEPAGKGSKGLLAVSDVRSMNESRARQASDTRRILDRWPSGSKLISHLTSDEGGLVMTQLTVANGHSPELNRDALVHLMAQDGFLLEREAAAGRRAATAEPSEIRGGKALFFRGNGKQATATIARDTQGRCTIVLQTTASLDAYQK